MRKPKEPYKRVTVALPLSLYGDFLQFAALRVWSDSKAGLFFIEQGLMAEKVRGKLYRTKGGRK